MNHELRRIVFPRQGEVVLTEMTLADPGPEDVLVRSLYSLMSIGTETTILHQRYDPDTHFARMFSFPQLQTGVQTVAAIEECGSEVTEFNIGDIVFLRRGHGSHHLISAAECSAVPAHMDLRQACWAGLAKTAFRAAWAAPFKPASHVLVIGAGPVGQMALRWAAAMGCATVTAVDVAKHRLGHAHAGGADSVLCGTLETVMSDIQAINGGLGPDVVVDSTGSAQVFQQALVAAAQYGKLVLLGDTGYPAEQRLSSSVMTKGLTIQAVHDSHDRGGWHQRKVDEHFFATVATGNFNLDGLIERLFGPEECIAAYNLAENARGSVVGIMFDWVGGD